jgi:CRISPR system Cascade subunit CasA
MRFDLVGEAWLPVRDHGGSIQEVSLAELFAEAPRWQGLAIGFAPEQVAVTRILVAVLQSALRGPAGSQERCEWLRDHAGCAERILTYLDRHRHRFDLFEPERPFMQQVVPEQLAATGTVAAVVLEWASGNNVTLFDHHVDEQRPALRPAHAARALLTTLLFQPGGGNSKPFHRTDSPGTKALMVVVKGGDMWQTLVGNSPALDTSSNDTPVWERATDHPPNKSGTTPLGWLDRATWRSRAVQLVADDDGMVRSCRIHQHLKLRDDPPDDPFVPVRQKEGEEPKIVRPPAGRRLWRAADVVLRGLAAGDRPTVVAQAVQTFERCHLPHPQMLVVGLHIDQGKVGDAQSALLPVTQALLEDDERLDVIARLLEVGERGAAAIRDGALAFQKAVGAQRNPRAAARWEEPYWAALAARFPQAMHAVAVAEGPPLDVNPLVDRWGETVRGQARSAFRSIATLDASEPRLAKALAAGEQSFTRKLRAIPKPTAEVA